MLIAWWPSGTEQLGPALDASARRFSIASRARSSSSLYRVWKLRTRPAEELAAARVQAEAAQQSVQSTISMAAEAELQKSLERLKEQTSQFPVQFEESIRAMLKRAEEELETKTTESTHTTFESLLKASDWYSKKAQTSMQASLEKAVEHSTSLLHERAGGGFAEDGFGARSLQPQLCGSCQESNGGIG